MININNVISLASEKDINSLKKWYEYTNKNKHLELLNFALSEKEFNDQEAKKLLYKTGFDDAYAHLKNDVIDDILNMIIFNYVKKSSSKSDQRADCIRSLLLYLIMEEKNEQTMSEKYINDVLSKANKNKCKDLKIIAQTLVNNVKDTLLLRDNAMQRLFNKYLKSSNCEKAEKIVDARLNDNEFTKLPVLDKQYEANNELWLFYKAKLEFYKENYKQVTKIFLDNPIFKKDITMQLSYRLLDIVSCIETNDYNSASKAINACSQWFWRKDQLKNYKISDVMRFLKNYVTENETGVFFLDHQKEIKKLITNGILSKHTDDEVLWFIEWLKSRIEQPP